MSLIVQLAFVQNARKLLRKRPLGEARKAPPGWFYDPQRVARYRYWTGSRWTEDTAEEFPGDLPPDSPS